jgi:hypothetical protein
MRHAEQDALNELSEYACLSRQITPNIRGTVLLLFDTLRAHKTERNKTFPDLILSSYSIATKGGAATSDLLSCDEKILHHEEVPDAA